MEANISNCIQEYLTNFYQGGLIGISDLANYCQIIEGELYPTLLDMQSQGELKVIKRYYCPEFHQINISDIKDKKSYCQECDLRYSNNQIDVVFYIQPLTKEIIK